MRRGFTFVELLVVITVIGTLLSIVLVSTQAIRQRQRNAQRATDIASILNAVYQYALDNNSQLPSALTNATTTICRTNSVCTNTIDLSVLVNGNYLSSIPNDPLSTSTSGYMIVKTTSNRVTVIAALAEGSTTLSVTR